VKGVRDQTWGRTFVRYHIKLSACTPQTGSSNDWTCENCLALALYAKHVVVGRIIVDVRNGSGKTERRECHKIISKGIFNAFCVSLGRFWKRGVDLPNSLRGLPDGTHEEKCLALPRFQYYC
jgi:hypothetical protein